MTRGEKVPAHRWLALLPAAALLSAPFVANRVEPRVFGLPFLLAWTVGAVLLTALTMAVIHRFDHRLDQRLDQRDDASQ